MPDSPQGPLRQVLAYGYAPLSLTRMGTIDPSADNATAVAFRTKTVQVVVAEPHSNGAIVAPLRHVGRLLGHDVGGAEGGRCGRRRS